jgi:uncharacterized protein (TIGR03435 family)
MEDRPVAFRRCLLLTAALLPLAVPQARAQAAGTAAPTQAATSVPQTAPATALAFDVASIRLNNTASDGHHHIYNDPGESHFRTVNLSLKDLLQFAYDLPASQIVGGPSWIDSTLFDIDAKSDHSIDVQLHALSNDQAKLQKRLMVQALIADRFHLTAHREIRQLPVYALVVAKGAPAFKPSEVDGTTINTGRASLHVAGSDDTIGILARSLAQILGRVVLNNTGISGRYDLTLRWTPDDAPAPASNGAPDAALPGIFTAIQEQLGLKLESTKGPVSILVLDHVEPPSAN